MSWWYITRFPWRGGDVTLNCSTRTGRGYRGRQGFGGLRFVCYTRYIDGNYVVQMSYRTLRR